MIARPLKIARPPNNRRRMKKSPNVRPALDCLNIWCHKWRLKLNITKSNVNHFRNVPKRRSEVDFNIGTDKIDYVSSYKYLGLILDEHLTFSEAIKDYVTVQTED